MWALLLFANGTILMLFNATVATAVFNITLPAEPLAPPAVYLDNIPVPALFDGRTLVVPTGGESLVTIKYVPKVNEINGVPAVNITTGDIVLIWAEAPLIVLPKIKILNFTRVGDDLVMLTKGPGVVAFALPIRQNAAQNPTSSTPTTQQTAQNHTTSTTTTQPLQTPTTGQNAGSISATPQQTPTRQSTNGQRPSAPATTTPLTPQQATGDILLLIWLVLPAVAFLAALALFLRRRRAVAPSLADVDKAVLEYVTKKGGAYESEIARDLGIPRTTVFRAVRRLQEQGLIQVVKRGGRNWVAPK